MLLFVTSDIESEIICPSNDDSDDDDDSIDIFLQVHNKVDVNKQTEDQQHDLTSKQNLINSTDTSISDQSPMDSNNSIPTYSQITPEKGKFYDYFDMITSLYILVN